MAILTIERTCTCIKTVELANDYNPKEMLEFVERREYQVDIIIFMNHTSFKVYQNGGWYHYVTLEESVFDEYFKLIE